MMMMKASQKIVLTLEMSGTRYLADSLYREGSYTCGRLLADVAVRQLQVYFALVVKFGIRELGTTA